MNEQYMNFIHVDAKCTFMYDVGNDVRHNFSHNVTHDVDHNARDVICDT